VLSQNDNKFFDHPIYFFNYTKLLKKNIGDDLFCQIYSTIFIGLSIFISHVDNDVFKSNYINTTIEWLHS